MSTDTSQSTAEELDADDLRSRVEELEQTVAELEELEETGAASDDDDVN